MDTPGFDSAACDNPDRLGPPCRTACPVDKNIPGFLRAITRGDHADAWRIIIRDNLFPGVLGWICPHPCEGACRLSPSDGAIPICDLKRWVTTSHLPPADLMPDPPGGGPAIAVVGAGPAGLAAAHDLAAAGAHVTLFDRELHPGGLLTDCIPSFRLPPTVVEDDIRRVLALGIEFRGGFELKKIGQLQELRKQGYAAVLLALGAGADIQPDIPGWRESPFAHTAIRLLRDVARDDLRLDGLRVAVVGGGNGAFDAARTALRVGAEEVHVLYRRGREALPAFPREVELAEVEGIRLHFHTLVEELEWSADTLQGVRCSCSDGATANVRSTLPVKVNGTDRVERFDAIVFAIGQTQGALPDPSAMGGVFSTEGSRDRSGTVVDAIASGRRAAQTIMDALTTAGRWTPEAGESVVPLRLPARTWPGLDRDPGDSAEPVPMPMSGDVAAGEAGRCLGCDRLLALDADACVLCGRCATGCDADALTWQPAANDTWQLVIDDDACRRCGDCVAGCPTRALEWRSWRHPNRVRPVLPDVAASTDASSSSASAGPA